VLCQEKERSEIHTVLSQLDCKSIFLLNYLTFYNNLFCSIEVPPVLDAGPTEEPLWSLKMRLRNVVSQINEEGR